MAIKAKTADSAFTTADWATIDATSLLDVASDGSSAQPTTSWAGATNALTGAITIDGIYIKVSSRVASPTGTFGVRLYNVTGAAAVAGTTVTINVSDLPYTVYSSTLNWVFFKFSAPVLLLAATNYYVQTTVSVAGEVTLWRQSTATSNWCRALRTTTLSAPAAGDTLWVHSEWTGAGANTPRTVTMDSTATTDYGDGAEANYPQLLIGHAATFSWGTTAATNYRLRLSGLIEVSHGGTYNMGTVGTPCPRDSTMELQFDQVTTNGNYHVRNFGTVNMYGQSRTSGKEVWWTTLNASTLAAGTTFNTADDTGWLNGDAVLVTGTQRSNSEGEIVTLSGNAGATSFTSSAGATYVHHGTGTLVARCYLLTRNVRIVIGGTATKFPGGVVTSGEGVTSAKWVQFNAASSGSNSGNSGIFLGGAATYDKCGFGNLGAITAASHYLFNVGPTAVGSLTLTSCFFGGHAASTGTVLGLNMVGAGTSTTAPVVTATDVHFAGTGYNIDQLRMQAIFGTFSNLYFSGTPGTALYFSADAIASTYPSFSMSGVTITTCGAAIAGAVALSRNIRISNLTILRTTGTLGHALTASGDFELDTFSIIGAASTVVNAVGYGRVILRNGTIKGETGYTSGIALQIGGSQRAVCSNMTFGGGGANEPMTQYDISISTGQHVADTPVLIFDNCTFTAATRINGKSVMGATRNCIAYQREGGVSGVHYREYPYLGYVRYETTTFRTAAPSERLQLTGSLGSTASPTTALPSSPRHFAVRSGYKVAVSVWVRKDSSYVGTQPRLVCGANASIGRDSWATVATMAGGADTWEELTATVPVAVAEEDGVLTCWVEADGTAGNVYVDDWSASEV